MADFYLDIETEGLEPTSNAIITIQYQRLNFNTKEAAGPLVILKAWESSEKEILEQFNKVLGISTWDFIAHGYNLSFEHKFLYTRSLIHGITPAIQLLNRPTVDLHPVGILLNGGKFKGSGLDNISKKEGNGASCLQAYKDNDYDFIERYIKQEADSFIGLYAWLVKKMPNVLLEFCADKI